MLFTQAVLLFICTSLCLTNLYGYYQCRGCKLWFIFIEHHKKMKDLKSKIGTQGLMHFAGKFMWINKKLIMNKTVKTSFT